MSQAQAIRAFMAVYVAAIGLSSFSTLWQAAGAHDIHVVALASAELTALALFIIRPTRLVGCAGLIAVFAVASAIEIAGGGAPYRFAIYASAAALIAILTRATQAVTAPSSADRRRD